MLEYKEVRMRQGCIMFSWLFNVRMDAVIKVVKMGRGRNGVRLQQRGREWIFPGLLYADDLVLSGKSEEALRSIVGRFVEVCRRRVLNVNASKRNVMMLGEEEGLECEVCIDEMRLENFSESKYLGCVLDESGTDEARVS